MSQKAAASNRLPSHEQLALIKESSSLALHKRAVANWPLNAKINLSMGSRPPDLFFRSGWSFEPDDGQRFLSKLHFVTFWLCCSTRLCFAHYCCPSSSFLCRRLRSVSQQDSANEIWPGMLRVLNISEMLEFGCIEVRVSASSFSIVTDWGHF